MISVAIINIERVVRYKIILSILLFLVHTGFAQEVYFFSEGTDENYYNQGIVDVNNLGESIFEYTHPPGGPQWNDKVPCSTNAYKGATSLKFNYTSSPNGNWKVSIYRSDWSTADLTDIDSLSFYIYSENEFPASALPLIALKTTLASGSGEITSQFYNLSDYNNAVKKGEWTRIVFPLNEFFLSNGLNRTMVKGIIFNQSETNNTSREILLDEIVAYKSLDVIPPVENLSAQGFDSHAHLEWDVPADGLQYRIYASFDKGNTFKLRGETNNNYYLDFLPLYGRNMTVIYKVLTEHQGSESEGEEVSVDISDLPDEELLDLIQRYTFNYFWDGAHQATGMSVERSNGNGHTVASGATGMGLMAMIVAFEREYESRDEIKNRILLILDFLENCDRYHGAWSHWYNADTYETQPFSADDDGGDIVETSYVAQGLIAVKNYFTEDDQKSVQIREKADRLWRSIDWDWYRQNGQNVLYWHWSPNFNFQKNMKVRGWNECLITYIMAAASPTHGVPKEVYDEGWTRSGSMVSLRSYYGYNISLSSNYGGPLFFIHYSHLGINPHGLKDQYADYWQEHVNTAKIHHAYAVDNPLNFKNYSDKCWGLTASDDPYGYTAHRPMNNDNGTISPTAALASMPYTPEESMAALKYFYRERGKDLFGIYGPYDAFNDQLDWVKEAYIGIDQGPIVVMIENYRTGLLWDFVMKDTDIQAGLDKLGFQYEISTYSKNLVNNKQLKIYPNPVTGQVNVFIPEPIVENSSGLINLYSIDGQLVKAVQTDPGKREIQVDWSGIPAGFYIIRLEENGDQYYSTTLIKR